MLVFSVTVLLLAVSLTAHLLLWKIRLPKNHIPALLMIFASVLTAALVSAGVFEVTHRGAGGFASIPQYLHIVVFYVSASLAYIAAYSGIEVDSPTLSLMIFISKGGAAGVAQGDASRFLAQCPFIKTRLTGLLESKLVQQDGDRLVLAGTGSVFFRLILAYRKLYGSIPKGG